MKRKNPPRREGSNPVVISTSWTLAGWLWHLALQVAGRSQGQFPTAALHVKDLYTTPERNLSTKKYSGMWTHPLSLILVGMKRKNFKIILQYIRFFLGITR